MGQVVLTINAGSSSVKFAVFGFDGRELEELARGQVDGLGARAKFAAKRVSGAKVQFELGEGAADHRAGMKAVLRWLGDEKLVDNVVAVGHRVLHGGRDFTQPARVDAALIATLRTLIPLGELHEPFNILGIEAAIEAFPGVPQVACFDTAFHRAQPFVADVYGLPRAFYDEGVRRYGFHGSVFRVCRTTAEDGRAGNRRRPRRHRPSRQRIVDVRRPPWPGAGDHHGHDAARRPADGHPRRPDRPRRAVLSDEDEGHERRPRCRT